MINNIFVTKNVHVWSNCKQVNEHDIDHDFNHRKLKTGGYSSISSGTRTVSASRHGVCWCSHPAWNRSQCWSPTGALAIVVDRWGNRESCVLSSRVASKMLQKNLIDGFHPNRWTLLCVQRVTLCLYDYKLSFFLPLGLLNFISDCVM
jgi:hypothetical protein